jgi:hypothetical protein
MHRRNCYFSPMTPSVSSFSSFPTSNNSPLKSPSLLRADSPTPIPYRRLSQNSRDKRVYVNRKPQDYRYVNAPPLHDTLACKRLSRSLLPQTLLTRQTPSPTRTKRLGRPTRARTTSTYGSSVRIGRCDANANTDPARAQWPQNPHHRAGPPQEIRSEENPEGDQEAVW